jgi:hypothetical protein
MELDTKTDWLTDRQSQSDFDFDSKSSSRESSSVQFNSQSVGAVVWWEVESVQSKTVICQML